jgi:hypothetical protein
VVRALNEKAKVMGSKLDIDEEQSCQEHWTLECCVNDSFLNFFFISS